MKQIADKSVNVDLNDIYGKEYMSKEKRDYEEAYSDIMKVICKHCRECTSDCPIGHKVWEFVKGEL